MAAVAYSMREWEKFKKHETDTGSTEVQIVRLTNRIKMLSQHCSQNRCDKHALLGLIKMLSQRTKLLKYLARVSSERYKFIIAELGIRK